VGVEERPKTLVAIEVAAPHRPDELRSVETAGSLEIPRHRGAEEHEETVGSLA